MFIKHPFFLPNQWFFKHFCVHSQPAVYQILLPVTRRWFIKHPSTHGQQWFIKHSSTRDQPVVNQIPLPSGLLNTLLLVTNQKLIKHPSTSDQLIKVILNMSLTTNRLLFSFSQCARNKYVEI